MTAAIQLSDFLFLNFYVFLLIEFPAGANRAVVHPFGSDR